MEIRSINESHTIIKIENCMEIAEIIEFRSLCSSLADGKPGNIVVDLNGVKALDSLGLGAFLSAQRKIRAAGGSFALMNLADELTKTLSLADINTVFTIYKSEEEIEPGCPSPD